VFVMATLPIAMYGIIQHALHYSKPHLQKYIIRILFMVPIYALNSWIVLKFPVTAIYLDTIRTCYEAFVIYNFMMYLNNFLRYEVDNFSAICASKKSIPWLCCFPNCSDGIAILERCKFGVLQYTLIRGLTSFVSYITEIFKVYHEGAIDFRYAWTYVALVNNFSQMIAMYCLILFYTVFRHELAPLRPIRQYLCIKFVIFVTFWQSILIAILVKFHIISENQWPHFNNLVDTVNGLQDFLICIEMFIASVAHILAFPVAPYRRAERLNWLLNIANAANVSDLHSEVRHHYNHLSSRVKGALRRSKTTPVVSSTATTSRTQSESDPDENTGLLSDELVYEYGVQRSYEATSNDNIVNI